MLIKLNLFLRYSLIFIISFWLYGIGRTMRETFYLNAVALFSGLFLGFAIPITLLLVLIIAFKFISGEKLSKYYFIVYTFLFITLAGCGISELWILCDEINFNTEVSKMNTKDSYSRPRVWPNQTASLIFDPDSGFHSND